MDGRREISDPAELRQAAAYEECGEKLRDALTARPSDAAVASSVDWHQQRGRYYDIIQEAIANYDGWMLDDDYESMAKLHEIIKRMRERAALALPPDEPARVAIPHEEAVREALEFCRDFKVTDSDGKEVLEDSLHEIRKVARRALAAPSPPSKE